MLVLVPSIALVSLWVTYTSSRYEQASDLRQTLHDVQRVGVKSEMAMVAMQEERRLSMEFLAGPRGDRARLDQARGATDQALAVMQEAAGPVVESNPPELKAIFGRIAAGLAALPEFRHQVDARQPGAEAAYEFYTNALAVAMSYFEAEAGLTKDTRTLNEGSTAAALFRALEYLSRQNAVLTSALASPAGMTPQLRAQFDQLVGAQRAQWSFVQPRLRGAQAEHYARITASPEWAVLAKAETSASASNGKVAIDAAAWQAALPVVTAQLQELTLNQVRFAEDFGQERVDELTNSVILVGALTLGSIVLALLISVFVSRALIRRLHGLRDSTRRLAGEQLPDVVERLKRGDKVELADVTTDFDHGHDEIGEVAGAFDDAQQIAVRAAIEQAETRQGVNHVFLNLAHRTQGLVHRQLALLDAMERKHEDPDLVAELFRIDHLATRMRRNAENLSVLGGTMPARRWRRPVRLAEVLRGAASQTEDYSRVKLTAVPETALTGPVAGDVMHLLSELVENATTFSPPHTEVRVSAELVPNGLGIEIEDRGLGMTPEAREEANRLLRETPEFNVMGFTTDTRLGLFVVARLALRHGISVQLRSSPYGGTSAVVLLPPRLLTDDAHTVADDSALGDDGEPGREHPFAAAAARRPVNALPAQTRMATVAPLPGPADPGRPPTSTVPARSPGRPPTAGAPSADRPRPIVTAGAADGRSAREAGAPSGRRLPRRVRQASLQPQLLRSADSGAAQPDTGPEHRPAEEARRMMAAFQRGSYKGRTEAGRHADDGDSPYRHGMPDDPDGQGLR